MYPRSITLSRGLSGASQAALCVAAMMATMRLAEAKPRVERMTERRIIRLEAMERRIEAAQQLPPRPADVRRALRTGVPVAGFGPNSGPAAAAMRPLPRVTPPVVAAPQPPVATASPRVVAQPQQARPVPSPAAESPAPVSPATAVEDGTRSVLVGGEPTLAAPAATGEPIEPIELLPPPPSPNRK